MIETLKQCKIEGNMVYLPVWKLPNSTFKKIQAFMRKNNAPWKTNKGGYEFPHSPVHIIEAAINGVDIKKKYQFYHTSETVVLDIIENIDNCGYDWREYKKILEPSAGQGHILDIMTVADVVADTKGRIIDAHMPRLTKYNEISCCELMPENQDILRKKGYKVIHDDFMTLDSSLKYDLILANPPFTKDQDIIHFRKMYDAHIDEGGTIYCVVRDILDNPAEGVQKEFVEWFNNHHGWVVNRYKPKDFKNGANVNTALIAICKLYG